MKKDIKKVIYTFVLIAVAVLSSVFIFVPEGVASANSAWFKYDGVNSVGALVRDENCPIVVDREDLTFDIYKDDMGSFFEEYEEPAGRVSAKYTFRNPTDITAKVELIFPFGYAPEYESKYTQDNKKFYSVTQDGSDIQKRIRNTYREKRENYDIVQFDINKDTKYLTDEYIEKYGFTKDTKVYEYVCDAKAGYDTLDSIIITEYYISSPILCKMERAIGDDDIRVRALCNEVGKARFFCFEELNDDKISCRASVSNDEKLKFEFVKETTLLDALASVRADDDGIEDVDLYNSFIARYDEEYNFINLDFEKEYRFRWYEYTLEFAPYQTIVNEVVAPLYPCVTRDYTPKVYNYTYLLSPAKSWASFGEFHLRINTDMYVKNASVGKMKKHKGYYEYSCQGLPDGELTFNICKSIAPITSDAWWGLVITGIAIAVTSVIWIPIIAVIIVKVRKKRIEKKVLQSYKDQKSVYLPVSEDKVDDAEKAFDGRFDIDDQTCGNEQRAEENKFENAENEPEDNQNLSEESGPKSDMADDSKEENKCDD